MSSRKGRTRVGTRALKRPSRNKLSQHAQEQCKTKSNHLIYSMYNEIK